MLLSESLITKFQQAHLEEFGYAISTQAAEADLLGLAELVEITERTHQPTDNDEDGEENGTNAI